MFIHPSIVRTVNGAVQWNGSDSALFPKAAKYLPEQPRGGVLRWSTSSPVVQTAAKGMQKIAAAIPTLVEVREHDRRSAGSKAAA